MNTDRLKRRTRRAAGPLLLFTFLLIAPVTAQTAFIGTAEGSITAPGAGAVPNMTINGEVCYSLLPQTSLPNQTPYRPAERYEDTGMESLLYAGYPIDGLGLQKKYGVSDDFARVVTQWAIWHYAENWPFDATDTSTRSRYLKELLQAARKQTRQEQPVAVEPAASFRRQNGYYRSEMLTLRRADGEIAIQQPSDGTQVLLENGTAATTLRQGDRFYLLAPDYLSEISLQIVHQFNVVTPVQYIPETADEQIDHLLSAQVRQQSRSGVWRFALPGAVRPSGTQAPVPRVTGALTEPPAAKAEPPEAVPSPQTGSPSTGGAGMPNNATTLLGLCWAAAGIGFLGKRSRNGGQ